MARTGFAKLYTRIWSDRDFIALPERLQRGFLMLISQGNLNAAGVIALQPRRWARFAPDSTPESITRVVNALEERRYVCVDWDTEELLVRSYIRNDGLWKQPNVMKGSFDDIEATLSDRLRAVLRSELERIPWDSLTGKMADEIRARAAEVIASLPTLDEVSAPTPKAPTPTTEPSTEGFSEGFPEGFHEGFGEGFGEPTTEPFAEPPVVVAVAVGVEDSSSSEEEKEKKKTSSSSSATNRGRDEKQPTQETLELGTRQPEKRGPAREDVERLCIHLADRIEGNGSKRPTITQRWRDAARLMLDKDGRTEDQVHAAIDWCQDDEFWRTNILSMPTLRKQYDRLRLAAQREQQRSRNVVQFPQKHTPNTEVWDLYGQRLAQEGDPW